MTDTTAPTGAIEAKTDRELLELAAKAAGMPVLPGEEPWPRDAVGWFYNPHGHGGGLWFTGGASAVAPWNPLKDSGQALDLAVELNMRLQVDEYGAAARIGNNGRWWGFEAHLHGGIGDATRRAIVRCAAAATGRSL